MDSRTGERITAHHAQSGVFLWEIENPLDSKRADHDVRPFLMNHDVISMQMRFNHNIRHVLGIHLCYLNIRVWTNSRHQTGRIFRVCRYQVSKYLDNLGVISINNVIRAVDHVLYDVLENTINVTETHDIKYNFY
uniref:Replication enhancer n=1 Tax=Tomato yellow leaf curl virus TaxID=10832 RepID=U5YJS7_9GEMI|nr:C3 protein [Tomato yellow leaf curl virus]